MRRSFLLGLLALTAAAVFAVPAMASAGPQRPLLRVRPGLPKRDHADVRFRIMGRSTRSTSFPDCSTCEPVSDAAPGHGDYNGGRWMLMQAYGITSQLTNAVAVEASASSIVDTGHRFVCPLIRAG